MINITDEQLEEYDDEYLDRLLFRITKVLNRRLGKNFVIGDLQLVTN